MDLAIIPSSATFDNMPAQRSSQHISSSSSSRPARTSTGNLGEGIEYNIHCFQSARNSERPYPSASNWYRRSNTDVPDDSFEDLGNVVVKL